MRLSRTDFSGEFVFDGARIWRRCTENGLHARHFDTVGVFLFADRFGWAEVTR